MTTVLALLVAGVVVILATRKKGFVPDSVSEIGYIIPHWAFSLWIAIVGMLLLPDMMEVLPDRLRFIGFLSVVGLFCVAASSYYRTEWAPLHYIGGVMCAVCSTIVTAVTEPMLLIMWAVYLPVMVACRWRNWCFWGELSVFLILVLTFIVHVKSLFFL